MTQPSETSARQSPLGSPSLERERGTAAMRVDLTEAVYRKVGLSRAESARLVERKGARTGRNPKTGVEVPIPPQRAIAFKPSDVLRKRLAAGEGTAC
jgi:integration host factor subunit alpha